MSVKKVILDALIPREDFEVTDNPLTGTTRNINTLGVRDLEYNSFFFSALRKPDFQRETNEWDAEKIVSLIESFITGDLIPAVILWRNPASYTFVIDGAHRLSALAAWINNDYGDGEISKQFFDGVIPEEQILAAEHVRKLVRMKVGVFTDYQLALRNSDKVSPFIADHARAIGTLPIQLQWVEGDAKKAEASFFKINQQAAPIDKAELELLKARRKPNGIATRAILRSGKGHKYWSAYSAEIQEKIQADAEEINKLLFYPLLRTPIKTLDLPIAGQNFSSNTQSLILDLVNRSNNSSNVEKLNDDSDGQYTGKFLRSTLKVVRRINSTHPSSLGLHPAIYFYSKEGRHKPISFMATIDFIQALDSLRRFDDFISVRASFEAFLLKYDYVIQQISRKYRSGHLAVPHIKELYITVMDSLFQNKSIDDIPKELQQKLKYLKLSDDSQLDILAQDFTKERKSEVFIGIALESLSKCSICKGFLHTNSITIDHIQRKADGGLGAVSNGQLAHPYCNSTYKN